MMLADSQNPLDHVIDHLWRLGGHEVPWMSSQIAAMILVGLVLGIALPLVASRHKGFVPRGFYRVIEMYITFIRDQVVYPFFGPAIGPWFVSFFATLLVFLLGLNVIGLAPLPQLCEGLGLENTPIGGTATSSVFVTGVFAAITLVLILTGGYTRAVVMVWKGAGGHDGEHEHGPKPGLNLYMVVCNALVAKPRPLPVAVVGGVLVWLNNFVPPVPGLLGLVLWPALLALEVVGYFSRCFALCIRLFANMTAGHLMLAVIVIIAAATRGWGMAAIGLPSALGGLAVMVLETLVAVLQAYLFTVLAAAFIGMSVNPKH
jgi:F-type H+-transporting ATPase subunit a